MVLPPNLIGTHNRYHFLVKRGIIRDGFEVYAEEILLDQNLASPV